MCCVCAVCAAACAAAVLRCRGGACLLILDAYLFDSALLCRSPWRRSSVTFAFDHHLWLGRGFGSDVALDQTTSNMLRDLTTALAKSMPTYGSYYAALVRPFAKLVSAFESS